MPDIGSQLFTDRSIKGQIGGSEQIKLKKVTRTGIKTRSTALAVTGVWGAVLLVIIIGITINIKQCFRALGVLPKTR